MPNASRSLKTLLTLAAAIAPVVARADIPVITGSFQSEVQRLKGLVFAENSNLYVTPTATQISDFHTLALTLFNGDYTTAQTEASALSYDLVNFTDTDTSRSYYELREHLTPAGAQTLGWGTFVLSTAPSTASALIEVPHPIFDTNTETIGAKVFEQSNAQFFLMAGAHRNANGTGTADVTHLTNTIFEAVHEAWSLGNGSAASNTAWQIHGFDSSAHAFPADTDAVLSDGAGNVTPRLATLDAQYSAHGLNSYVYNTLSSTNPTNVAVNTSPTGTVYAGSTFDDLGATTNVQSQFSRAHGGTFVHAEMSETIRFNAANRAAAATSLASAIVDNSVATKRWDGDYGHTDPTLAGSWTALSSAGNNWSPDGLPDASNDILFDNSLIATLPAAMSTTAAAMTVKYITWNSNDSSQLSSTTTTSTDRILTLAGDGVSGATPLLSMGALATSNTLTFVDANTGTGTGRLRLQLAANGAFNVSNPGATLVIASRILEDGTPRNLEKTGDGTLLLSNTGNAFTNGMTFTGGVVSIASFLATGPTPTAVNLNFYTFNGGTLRYTGPTPSSSLSGNRGFVLNSAGGTLDITDPAALLTLNGRFGGSGTLTKTGAGELTLASSTSTFTGGVIVTGGILSLSSGAALGAVPAPAVNLTLDGGTFKWTGTAAGSSLSANRKLSLGATGGTININDPGAALTVAGDVLGTGSLTKTGPGELLLTSTNSYAGPTTITAGTLSVSSGSALGATPAAPSLNLIINGGTFNWTGNDATLSSLRQLSFGPNNATINVAAPAGPTSFTINGSISGAGALTKTGTGELVLATANTYTGTTTVAAGTLTIANGAALGTLPAAPLANSLSLATNTTLRWTGNDATLSPNRGIALTGSAASFDIPSPLATLTIAGPIDAPTASLTKTGPGGLTIKSPAYTQVTTNGGFILNAGKLSFDYTALSAPDPRPLLKLSHDSANFTDPVQKIRTANPNDPAHGIGYYDDATATLSLLYTWYGDANLDGTVNADDYALLDRAAAKHSPASWVNGDFNYDNTINAADYLLIDTSFGKITGAIFPTFLAQRESEFGAAYVSELIASVPEPTSLLACGFAMMTLNRRRRR